MNTVIAVVASCIIGLVSAEGYKRVCYYSNWSQYRPGAGKYLPIDIDPTLCTHLIYSFAKLDSNHELAPYEWNDISALYPAFNQFKVGTNISTLLAVGGWNAGSKLFSEMVSSKYLREKFARQSVRFIVDHDFDGLDLDWEYPANREGSQPSDRENFIILLQDIRKAMINQGQSQLLLTAAVAAGESTITTAYDIPGMVANLDFINLMSYDLNGAWDDKTGHNSPLYSRAAESPEQKKRNVDWAAKHWVEKGTPPEMLIIGLATYGRHFTLSNPSITGYDAPASGPGTPGPMTREPGFLAYYEICAMIASGGLRTWDDEHKVPYLVLGNQWVGYDDELSFGLKLNYIMDNSYGGAMIWNIDLDDFNYQCSSKQSDRYPLMSLMRDMLGDYVPTTRAPVTGGTGGTSPATTDGPIVTDRPTNPPGDCNGVVNYAYFIDPNDCSVYHRCVHGQKLTYQCPNGLLWNIDRNYCDYPVNVNCVTGTTNPPTTEEPTTQPPTTEEPTTQPPTTEEPTTQPPTTEEPTTQPPTTEEPTTQPPTTQEPTTQPPTTEEHTTQPPTTTKSPTLPPTNNFCANKATGLYKKADDCQSFYNCAHGVTTVTTCAAGTLYNAEAKICDWAANVDCDDQDAETDFCAGKKARLYGYPDDCSKYYNCGGTSTTIILTCPPNTLYDIKARNCDWKQNVRCGKRPTPGDFCYGKKARLYANPEDCSKYYKCSGGTTDTVILTCPTNQYYNIKPRKCDLKDNVWCGKRPTPADDEEDEETPVDICATKGDGLHQDPTDCHSYIHCSHGVKYHKTCGSLAFNPTYSYCDWSYNVPDCQ